MAEGTDSKTEKQLKTLEQLVGKLGQLQAKFTVLVKDGKSLEEVNKKVERTFNSLSKEFGRLQRTTETLINKKKTLAKTDEQVADEVLKLQKGLKQAESAYQTYTSRVRSANAASEKLANEQRRLAKEQERAAKAADFAAERQKFFGKAFFESFSPQSIGKAIASVIKFISVYEILGAAVNGVTGFFTGAFKAFADFDSSLAKISAVTGATGEDLKVLESEIRQIAVETKFSANEISELTLALGKLGVSSKEIPSLLRPIADAATATGEDVTSVGEALVKVGNQFQVSTNQAATTAAVLTGAVNETSLSLSSFNTAIGYVGPIANQVGLSFEQTAAALGVLSDSGFSASRAGTGLRRVLLELKKPGENIIDTLRALEEQNIGVAEAQELVGKQGAAQLLSLLQNLDAVEKVTLAEEGYASQLNQTAKNMATFNGQLDILTSTYNELLLSVGEFLVSNELVIELIGTLSSESEVLARGYKFLRQESDRLGESFEKRVAIGLKKGSSELEILNSLLKDTDQVNIKRVLEEVNNANPKNLAEVRKVLQDLIDVGQFTLTRDAKEILGALDRIAVIRKDFQANGFVEKGERAINREYGKQVKAILEIEDAETRRTRAIKASAGFRAAANRADEKANKLLAENAEANKFNASFLQGQAQAYRALANELSEYTSKEKTKNKVVKDATDIYLNVFNEEREALELRLKNIDIEQKAVTDAYRQKVKDIKDEFELRSKADLTLEQRTSLEIERTQKLSAASDEYRSKLDSISEGINTWSSDSEKFYNKYERLFSGSEKNTLNLLNVNERFRQSLVKLAEETSKLGTEARISGQDYADLFIQSGINLTNDFTNSLSELGKEFGNTAYEQYQLSLAQRDGAKELESYIKKLEEYYNSVKGQLSPEEQQRIELALSALKKIYADALKGIISDTDQENLKKQFVVIGKLAGEDFIASLDVSIGEGIQMVLDSTLNAISKFNDTAFENTKNRLDAEKNALRNQAEIEDEILSAKLEGQLITEAEYRAQVEKNRRKDIQAQNKIDKQIFEAQQKRDRQNALTDYLTALASIIPNLIVTDKNGDPIGISVKAALTGALATASYAAELRAINQRKFFPTKFAEGGIVNGPSHAEGGVPFTVRGQGGYEMEGGEYIVNKKATQKYKVLLDQINGYGKSNYKFAAGGVVKDPTEVANRQIELLEAIASSNISMVGKLDKPVRAFVATSDLRSDENARRIQERNSQL